MLIFVCSEVQGVEVGNEDGGRQIGENKVHSVEGDTNGGQRKGDKGREKG